MKKYVLFALIFVLAFANVCSSAPADSGTFQEMTIKLGHVLEVSHFNHTAALYFADLVNKKTDGKVKVEVYPASQLGDEGDENEAMILGTLELGLFGIGEAAKRDEALSIFDSAYVFNNRDHLVKVLESDIFKQIADESPSKSGIRPLAGIYYGTRNLSTGNVKVQSIDDMKGLKIRCPNQDVFLNVVTALGAQPSPLALSEVYLALQQGVMDGQENPLATIQAMKFYEVQKFCTLTGHIVNADFFMTSAKWFDTLTPEMQKVIQESADEAAAYINPISFKGEDDARKFLEERGMTVVELAPAELERFVQAGKATHPAMIEQWGGMDRYNAILDLGK